MNDVFRALAILCTAISLVLVVMVNVTLPDDTIIASYEYRGLNEANGVEDPSRLRYVEVSALGFVLHYKSIPQPSNDFWGKASQADDLTFQPLTAWAIAFSVATVRDNFDTTECTSCDAGDSNGNGTNDYSTVSYIYSSRFYTGRQLMHSDGPIYGDQMIEAKNLKGHVIDMLITSIMLKSLYSLDDPIEVPDLNFGQDESDSRIISNLILSRRQVLLFVIGLILYLVGYPFWSKYTKLSATAGSDKAKLKKAEDAYYTFILVRMIAAVLVIITL